MKQNIIHKRLVTLAVLIASIAIELVQSRDILLDTNSQIVSATGLQAEDSTYDYLFQGINWSRFCIDTTKYQGLDH